MPIEFLAVVGIMALAAIGVALVAFAWHLVTEPIMRAIEMRAAKVIDAERARASRRLADDARWLSEDPPTRALIEDLARGVEIGQAREKWRAAVAAKEAGRG